AHLFVVTEGARQNLIGKGVPAEKVTVMPHWIDEELFKPVSDDVRRDTRAQHGWNDAFVILFAGNIGLVQGLETVIEAARHIPQNSNIRIVIVGDGADKARLVQLANELQVTERVTFIDRQPMEAMPAFMAASDALLVHLRRSELSRYVIPTKTLAYLGASRPILMAMEGAAADLVAAAGAGPIVTPQDPERLARAMMELASMSETQRAEYGQRGRAYLLANLRKQDVLTKYEQHLANAAAKR
ncbi:MAG: glycosyltransferase family 4 protein, partial [Thermoanaerobaculia bacterium]